MADETSATPQYTMGYSEEFRQMLDRRSAESHAGYLLPHLKRGDRVLDFGCGPGAISVGLARLVDPGELHGIDMEESQIDLARAAAEAGGHANAAFHVGDATQLPFEDNSFDAAHCHAVLMHVPDTAATLAEVKRVLKPGGVIGAREAVLRAAFLHPYDDRDAWGVFSNLIAANGGHPQMGMELKGAFLDAGFTDPVASFSFDSYSTPNDVAFFYSVAAGWFFSPQVTSAALKYGLATQEQFDEWLAGLDTWKATLFAVGAVGFGECVAYKA